MNRTVFENQFITIKYDQQTQLMTIIWKENLKNLTNEEFMKETVNIVPFIEKYKPKYYLQDTRRAIFVLTSDIQDWIKEKVTTVMEKYGAKKNALLTARDFLTGLSLDDFVEKMNKETKIERRFFYDIKKAKEWLFND